MTHFGLFATTNGIGGVCLFFTTGAGGTRSNSVVRVTDASGWNQPINVTARAVLYTATGATSLKGLTFVPQGTANAVQLIPPPVLIPQNGANVASTFTVTNAPSDSTWHGAITAIHVNGTLLPSAAYDKTQSGTIVFYPSQSTLLQGSGAKNITVSATGYSDDAVTLNIAGIPQPTLSGAAMAAGKFKFSFTSSPGLNFSVLGTNNLTAPVSTWPVIGTAVEGPAGTYNFTNSAPATSAAQFYMLRQP